jgi:hypothetical protein
MNHVPDLFTGDGVPIREAFVLDHGFVRDMQACRRLLPDDRMWPPELDQCSGQGGRRRLDRRTIFAIAKRAAADQGDGWAAAQLHAAIVFWGAPPGIPMKRAARPLAETGASQSLNEALKVVRGEGPASAYAAMSHRGRLRIKGLASSYFTKFLYFGGYEAKKYMSQPLIMDDVIVGALKRLTSQPWEAGLTDYIRYLDLAADWAYEFNTAADVIERRLYQIGQ